MPNDYLRALYLGAEGRGEGQPGVRGLQPAATCAVHIDYLVRLMSAGKGKVVVVSGYNADVAAKSYNPKLIGVNNRKGRLGDYQPVVGYMTREQFEAIGGKVTPTRIPPY